MRVQETHTRVIASLFDAPSDAPVPRVTRTDKMKLCYRASSDAWKEATHLFATTVFLLRHGDFIFEDLTTAYEEWAKTHGKPATIERRAFAGLLHRLLREKLISRVDGSFRARSQGNASQVYRSLVKGDGHGR